MSNINIQTFSGKVNISDTLTVNGNIYATYIHGNGSNLANINATSIDGTLSQWTGDLGDPIYYESNVGIGTTDPQHTLDVHGTANVGVLTATYIYGDGSNIENIVSSQWEGTPGNPIYYDNNVGIGNTAPVTKTLQVGSNLYVEDTGSNVLVVTGNIASDSITLGAFSIVPSYGLDQVTNESNSTSHTVRFTNATTGFVTTANVSVGNELTVTGNVAVDTDTLFVDSVNDRVGIGVDTPEDTLHVNGGIRFAGHMIPTLDATFDIGSADKKVRDMYVDDNSLWIGDQTKITFESEIGRAHV